MTLPTTGALSLSDVLTELKIANPSRTVPIILGDADVLALAGKSAPPISLSDLYGKSAYSPVTAVGNNATGSSSSAVNGGTAACSPSVTPSGGLGTYTYSWSFDISDGCTLSNATLRTCLVAHIYSRYDTGSASAVLRCVVSDGRTSVTVTGITANLDWSS